MKFVRNSASTIYTLLVVLLKLHPAFGQCPLCSDGNQPTNLNEELRNGLGTCESLTATNETTALTADSDECYRRQLIGYHECGCPTMPRRPPGTCNLCVDPADTPDLDAFQHAYNPNRKCIDLAEDIVGLAEDDFACKKIQYTGFRHCGCSAYPSLPKDGHCTLCPDGSAPEFPKKSVREGGTFTCAQWADEVPFFEDYPEECLETWEKAGSVCGCRAATASCSICGTKGVLNPSASVELEDGETVNCQILANRGEQGILDATKCRVYQYLAREVCCGEAVACTLCEDGSKVPDPFEKAGSSSTNVCGSADGIFNDFPEASAFCDIGQAFIGTICGCDNPIAVQSTEVCNICEENEVFAESAITTATLTGVERSCPNAVSNANFAVAQGYATCTDLQRQYSKDCCKSRNAIDSGMNVTTSPSPAAAQSANSSAGTGVIVGGAIGGLAFFCLALLGFTVFLKKKRWSNDRTKRKEDPPTCSPEWPAPGTVLAEDVQALPTTSLPVHHAEAHVIDGPSFKDQARSVEGGKDAKV